MAKNHRWLRIGVALLLVGGMVWGAVMLVRNNSAYQQERTLHQEVLAIRPLATNNAETKNAATSGDTLRKWREQNPDIVGWLSIPGTPIDYPFVQTENNSDYLRRDLNGDEALAGSIFMDYRCNAAAPGSNTILYGHNLQNDAMFGSLQNFTEDEYFAKYQEGKIFLNGDWYNFTIFACLRVAPDDAILYDETPESDGSLDTYLHYVRTRASQFTQPEDMGEKPLITLSTCSGASGANRVVVLGVVG